MTCSDIKFTKLLYVVALDERPTEGKAMGNQVVKCIQLL